MKKIMLLCTIFFSSSSLMALRGVCFTYGRDPRSPSPYNYQEKYFVDCDCNCSDTMEQCKECGHYHDTAKQIVVSQNDQPVKRNTITTPPTQQEALAYLSAKIKSVLEK